ncbi:hypothetical protein BD626DRAFT_499194 [Schizophyllum amplum]|uniref:Uncharacterized protein n=1 Tax=Schizophyllum amplum TaxID=97359 RepID=A0A550CCL0_9AGAR|nr:hypothetical protein BD626DRAFT_499194 [Auriculariopsis ampla]
MEYRRQTYTNPETSTAPHQHHPRTSRHVASIVAAWGTSSATAHRTHRRRPWWPTIVTRTTTQEFRSLTRTGDSDPI